MGISFESFDDYYFDYYFTLIWQNYTGRMLRRLRLSGSFIAALILITGFVYLFRTTGILARTLNAGPTTRVERPRKIEVTIFAPTANTIDTTAADTAGAKSVVYNIAQTSVDRPAKTVVPKPSATAAGVAVAAQPTLEPTPEVVAVAPPAQPAALPLSARLEGIRHQQQSWNNCGPATLSMMLSYYGQTDTTQQVIAKQIKPFKDDKNTSPEELVSYAASVGYRARIIQGGDITLLKTLIANKFPVIVETWFIPEPDDEMGHYQLLVGYEDDVLRFYDSYHGPNIKHPSAELDALWKVFNRLAIVVWPEGQDEQMKAVLGARWDEQTMLQSALATAQAEAAADPQDKFAQFNIGTSLLKLGDTAGAVQAYQNARTMKLPWRMLWYQFGLYEANFAQGNYEDVIKITSETLKVKAGLEESYYWRGVAKAAMGNNDAARQDLQQALQYRENYEAAQTALDGLP